MSKGWSYDDIPDLTGKVIVVTGANTGIGFEAAKGVAQKGATTILACRNREKADIAAARIRAVAPEANVPVMELDLSSFASIKSFAEAFCETYDRLDVLLNNAGIMMTPYGTTKDGLEQQNGVNHFGHFALTGRLLGVITRTPDARVVSISSNGHKMGAKMDFENLLFEGGKGYTPIASYARSKLANLLFTYELQRRFEEHHIDAMALAAHPGGSDTDLARHIESKWYARLLMPLAQLMMQSAEMGALPGVRAAVDPQAKGGQYYGPSGFQELRGAPVVVTSNKESHNEEDARKLWEVSEKLTGVTYIWPQVTH